MDNRKLSIDTEGAATYCDRYGDNKGVIIQTGNPLLSEDDNEPTGEMDTIIGVVEAEDAAELVRRFNAFPALVDALESLAERVDGYSYDPDTDTGIASALGHIADEARALLANLKQ